MSWVLQKLDALIGGVIIAAAGVAATQAHAFLVQYLQRLGGHLDEAKAHLNAVQHGLRYQLMSDTVRKELETEAQKRVNELQSAYHAIADANVIAKPFAFFRHADTTMINGTWHDFVPSLSVTSDTFVYVGLAVIAAFLAYEIVKLPFLTLLSEPRRRRFRKRG